MDKFMTLLNWIGQDAAHFFGTLIMVGVILEGLAAIIRALAR